MRGHYELLIMIGSQLLTNYLTKILRKILWCKKTINMWDVNVNNIVFSKLVETKTNSKYLKWCKTISFDIA